jgi:hypothetical protein
LFPNLGEGVDNSVLWLSFARKKLNPTRFDSWGKNLKNFRASQENGAHLSNFKSRGVFVAEATLSKNSKIRTGDQKQM